LAVQHADAARKHWSKSVQALTGWDACGHFVAPRSSSDSWREGDSATVLPGCRTTGAFPGAPVCGQLPEATGQSGVLANVPGPCSNPLAAMRAFRYPSVNEPLGPGSPSGRL